MDSKVVINRRTAIGAALVAASPLLLPGRVRAQGTAAPANAFVILLKGLYQPVVLGPNLGLSAVDLSDGSYLKTKIYPVSGTPGNQDPNKAIGDFYVQLAGNLCAYHIPGGSFAMQFTGSDFILVVPDGAGWELPATERSSSRSWRQPGSIKPFVGGHNHMVDILHLLAPPQAAPMSSASATSAIHEATVVTGPNGKARSGGPSSTTEQGRSSCRSAMRFVRRSAVLDDRKVPITSLL